MNGFTRFTLVLLRLAIGWHFLFEGIDKIESTARGPSELSRPFSSEAYLREANGPLGDFMRSQIGDPDARALAFLTLKEIPADADPARSPARRRISPALDAEWDAYFERFVAHYHLDAATDKIAYERARAALEQAKEQAGTWLISGKREIENSFPTTTFRQTVTTPERVTLYRRTLEDIERMLHQELPAFDKDVAKAKIKSAKAEAARMRTELLAELNAPLQEAMAGVLSDAEKKVGPVPEPAATTWKEWSRLQWIDAITSWGLVVVGLGLLLGLFTRTCCVAGALFLCMLYLTAAPFPWLPEPSRVEGHYYFVNKNLVEMFALLALATTQSGCWVGLDGLVRFLNPLNWRRSARS
jgi:uncharacterized membrane protein YphA (DoxX/SURF4 family)